MPESESSHTAHFSGGTPASAAVFKKISGAGLRFTTSAPVTTAAKYAPEVAFDLYPVGGGCDRAGKAAALKLAKKRNRPRHNVNELSRVLAEEAVRFLLHPFLIRHAVHLRNAADICAVSHSAKPREIIGRGMYSPFFKRSDRHLCHGVLGIDENAVHIKYDKLKHCSRSETRHRRGRSRSVCCPTCF